jgi:carnitine monooxygenase subunit
MPGRPNLSIGPVIPLTAERTYRFLDYFVAPDADDGWIADLLAFDDQVGAEDKVLVERVQAGVRSRVLDAGRLLPESEQLIAHFQGLLVDALAA